MHNEPDMEKLSAVSDADLFETWNQLLSRLERWLDPKQREALGIDMEAVARIRYGQRIPLHEIVYAFHLLRNQTIHYVREQAPDRDYLELYAEGELEHWLANFFDFLVYHTVRGYELAFLEQPTR
jgi:hypothetical protein